MLNLEEKAFRLFAKDEHEKCYANEDNNTMLGN